MINFIVFSPKGVVICSGSNSKLIQAGARKLFGDLILLKCLSRALPLLNFWKHEFLQGLVENAYSMLLNVREIINIHHPTTMGVELGLFI